MKNKLPFFVAEVSANHRGSINIAKKLILTAKKNGADAVKIQTYTPDTMTIKSKPYFKNYQRIVEKLLSLGFV